MFVNGQIFILSLKNCINECKSAAKYDKRAYILKAIYTYVFPRSLQCTVLPSCPALRVREKPFEVSDSPGVQPAEVPIAK